MRLVARGVSGLRPRLLGLRAACCGLALLAAAAHAQAPALGDAPLRPKSETKPGTRRTPERSALTVAELATEADGYESAGAYALAAETERVLSTRVAPDVDLEISIALNLARSGHRDEAWQRLTSPLVTAAEHDSMPEARRVDHRSDRGSRWINGVFDGWHWYIWRARAELAAGSERWDAAHAAARECVAARPRAGKEWLILAVCAAHAGDLDEARGAAQTAAELDPTLPEASYLNGWFAWRDGRRVEAQGWFRSAFDLDSTYITAGSALVRCRLPLAKPDSLPKSLLTGIRELGLLTSSARPKLEESIQWDMPAVSAGSVIPSIPDSIRRLLPPAALTIPVLVDTRGRIALHELPEINEKLLPVPVITRMLATFPQWRFTPAQRHHEPQASWAVIDIPVQGSSH